MSSLTQKGHTMERTVCLKCPLHFPDTTVSLCLHIFKSYFIDYAITVAPIVPPLLTHSVLSTPSGNPTPLFMSMGHMCKFFGCSISYTVLYIPMAIL